MLFEQPFQTARKGFGLESAYSELDGKRSKLKLAERLSWPILIDFTAFVLHASSNTVT